MVSPRVRSKSGGLKSSKIKSAPKDALRAPFFLAVDLGVDVTDAADADSLGARE